MININAARELWAQTIYNRAQPEAKDIAEAEKQVVTAIENGEYSTKILVPQLTLSAQQETWALIISKKFSEMGFDSKCFTEEINLGEHRWFVYVSGWANDQES